MIKKKKELIQKGFELSLMFFKGKKYIGKRNLF